MKALAPQLSALELKSHLLEYTDPTSALTNITVSGGRLNAHSAVLNLQGSYLRVASLRIETTTGNADQFVNPGEQGNILVTFRNIGTETAPNATASAASLVSSSDISISNTPITLGNIAAGDTTSEFSIPFTVQAGTPTPTYHQFEISTSDDNNDGEIFASSLDIYTSTTISGRVYSLEDNSNIIGALIQAEGEIQTSTNTSKNGNFTLNVVDGTYDLTVSAAGFINTESTGHVVPPSVSGLSIGLGIPDLTITPSSISETLYAGTIETVDLTLSNDGTAPVEWSLVTQRNNAAAKLIHQLPAKRYSSIDPDRKDDTNPSGEVSILLGAANTHDFTGLNIAFIGSNSSTLEADIESLGGNVSTLTFPLSSESLDTIDTLVIDDDVNGANSSDITFIRDWVTG